MDYLTSCPREVRDQIYGYVLIVKVTIVPYPADFQKCEKAYQDSKSKFPSPALLAVSKQISDEARSILYGKNHWQLSNIHSATASMEADSPSRNIFWFYPKLFRYIILAFDQRDVKDSEKLAICKEVHAKPPESWTEENVDMARFKAIHSGYLKKQGARWIMVRRAVSLMKNLQLVTIDLENLFCPTGCCRLRLMRQSSRPLRDHLWFLDPLEYSTGHLLEHTRIEIIGMHYGSPTSLFLVL